jgi:hypothetical protein
MRHTLKRGFLPILLVVLLGFGFSVSGIFDQIVGNYEERGSEDSGRFALWPLAVERLIDSPLAGVEDIATYVPEFMKEITPHNGFLYIGLTAGVLPLILFTAYWVNAFRGAFKLSKGAMQDAPFQLPLIIYIFIISSFSATGFMYPWAIVVLCNAIPRPRIPNRIIRFGLLRHGSVGQPAVNRAPSYALRGVALPPTKQLPVRQVSTKYKI